MKILLTLIFILALCDSTPDIIGTYRIDDPLKIDELELKEDKSFVYYDRGDSCWLWSDVDGKWNIKNDTLVLIENRTYLVVDDDYQMTSESHKKVKHYFLIKNKSLKSISTDLADLGRVYYKL